MSMRCGAAKRGLVDELTEPGDIAPSACGGPSRGSKGRVLASAERADDRLSSRNGETHRHG